MNNFETIGFIGTGGITAAVVSGLRSSGAEATIYLSPRSKQISLDLAGRFPGVYRLNSNADVVARSQLVALAVRPEQLQDALADVTFKPEQTVVSFVATVPLAEISRLVAPACNVCRVTPLTTAESARGPIVMAPAIPSVRALFEGLGDLLIAENEEQMMAFGCAAAVVSTFFELEHTVAQWLSSAGVTPANASLYVRSMFAGVACAALENGHVALTAMADGNETPGGLNEHVRAALRGAGLFARIDRALTELASLSLASSSGAGTSNLP